MRYKIKVIYNGKQYEQYLYKRKFLKWKIESWNAASIPFPEKVAEWQIKYNIPDRRVHLFGKLISDK